MSLGLRKQFPEFEMDEFTDEKLVTVDEAVNEIKTFDWTTESRKSSELIEQHAEPTIMLQNLKGDQLSIYSDDFKKFGINLKIAGFIPRSSISTVGTAESIIDIVKLLNNGDRTLLIKKLEASEYHYKMSFILNVITKFASKEKTRNSRETVRSEFLFKINLGHTVRKLFWSILFLFMAPVISLYAVIIDGKEFYLELFLWMQLVLSLFALPGIIISINHWINNGHWKVYFQKGTNTFFIVTPYKKEVFDKKDFGKRIRTENSSNAPWNSFEYTTLVKSDGRQLHFSNLLVPSSDMDRLFGRIEETTEKKGFQIIKDKKITAANSVHMS